MAARPLPAVRHVPPVRLAVAVAVAALTLVPLAYVLVSVVAVGPAEAARLLWRPRVGELLRNTVGLTVAGCVASAVIGTGAAWLVERTTLPGRRLWTMLMAAPLAVPAFVNSYGWVSVTSAVEGFAGAVLITTLSYFPLVYLPVAAVLRGMDPAFEDMSRALGNGPWRTFFRVVLPQLRPAVLGGTMLVGLHLLAEFGALQSLRFPTFTTAIYDQFESTFNGPAATMLAGVLVLSCLLLLVAELRFVGRARVARVGAGVARAAVPHPLGSALPVTVLGMAALAVLALGVPLGSLAYWLVVGSSTAFPLGMLAAATATSIGLGAAGAVATCVLAVPVAWLSLRRPGLVSRVLERSTYIAGSLPGVVVALSLVTLSIAYLPTVYQTTALLVAAYAVLFMPRAMVSLRSALAQVPPEFDDTARVLGARPAGVLWRVTLPLVVRGLGAGAALVFLAVVTELTATLLLAPIGTTTLATEFWSNTYGLAYGAAAPYALLMIVISAPAAYLLTRESRRTVPGR
ncbi:ABC transporter permease [Pseudonocardia bannensis]|uniref:ABC transporter permease n=1 Tax=Pseudonocardia bannensis TaxID=630973 RepID=UPI001B7CEB13|nr:iron ABC transporter permease [Pseudonocardia bannensis]